MEFRNKTLQELEGVDWREPTYDSHLVTECHRLRRVPLKDFTVENLRIMMGQQIGLPYLVPLALEVLSVDPLARGDMYEGDLLRNVSRVPEAFWNEHPDLRRQLKVVTRNALKQIEASEQRAQSEGAQSEIAWLGAELKFQDE